TVLDNTDLTNLTSLTLTTDLTNNTTYYWHVRYQDNNGAWSDYSPETSFIITLSDGTGGDDGSGDTGGGRRHSDTTAPGQVNQVVLSVIKTDGINKVNLDWVNPDDSDFAGTRIYRSNQAYSEVGEAGFALINETNSTVSEYLDNLNIEVGQTYYYILRTFDTSNNQENNTTVYSIVVEDQAVETEIDVVDEDETENGGGIIDEDIDQTPVVENNNPSETEIPTEEIITSDETNEINPTGMVLSQVVTNPEAQTETGLSEEDVTESTGFFDRIKDFFKDFWNNVGGNLDQLSGAVLAGDLGSFFDTANSNLLSFLALILAIVIFLISIITFKKKK
ncbi:MAG: hypothetical protein WCX88_02210, partial [Patescibacteria group bacterium]